MKGGPGIAVLLGGKPSKGGDEADESREEMGGDDEEEGESIEEAAKEFIAAIKSGDVAGVLEGFRALKRHDDVDDDDDKDE